MAKIVPRKMLQAMTLDDLLILHHGEENTCCGLEMQALEIPDLARRARPGSTRDT